MPVRMGELYRFYRVVPLGLQHDGIEDDWVAFGIPTEVLDQQVVDDAAFTR